MKINDVTLAVQLNNDGITKEHTGLKRNSKEEQEEKNAVLVLF